MICKTSLTSLYSVYVVIEFLPVSYQSPAAGGYSAHIQLRRGPCYASGNPPAGLAKIVNFWTQKIR